METKNRRCPKRITVSEALELSIPERIQLVEGIWDTISIEAEEVELTGEEKKIIDERLDAYHKNPYAGSQWDIVLRRVSDTFDE